MHPRKSEGTTEGVLATAEVNSPGDKAPSHEKKDKADNKAEKTDKAGDKDVTTIEDLSLPRSIITRLAKGILPPNTQIQGNAILALSKSATVFISYLAAHANENTVAAGKKTLAAADVFKALDDIELGFLKERLEAEFKKFNAIQIEKRTNYRQKVKAAKTTTGDTDMADITAEEDSLPAKEAEDGSWSRAAKKQRIDADGARGPDDDEDEDEVEVEDDDDDDDGDDDDDEDDEVEEAVDEEGEEEEDDDEEDAERSAEERQDALEERQEREDADEALDGDESD